MPAEVLTRRLGRNGPSVAAVGFGTMGLSAFYGPTGDDETRLQLLDCAHAIGATFWDSSDLYGDSEELLGKWFARTGKRDDIFLATKFGHVIPEDGGYMAITIDSSPEHCLAACEKSLERLGVDCIDLYYIHRFDHVTPVEKTMEALVKLKEAGKIKHIGLSEASAATIRRAHAISPIACVQMEYSPFSIDIESAELGILSTCRELGIAVIAYSPLSRGFLTGAYLSPDDFAADDVRRTWPRFAPENFAKNLELVDGLKGVAEGKGVTVGQLTLAWLLKQGEDIIPIPGTRRIKYLEENMGALEIELSDAEEKEIRDLVTSAVVGSRYPEELMASLVTDTPEL